MVFMLEKKYVNQDMNIELTSYIDSKQNVWFWGKDIARILGYSDTRKALRDHVSDVHKQLILWLSGWGNESLPQHSTNGWGNNTTGQQNMWWKVPSKRRGVGNKGSQIVTPAEAQNKSQTWCRETRPQGKWCTFIDEAGFYEIVFSSKLEAAKKFRDWVFTTVLPSFPKYGQYKLFDNPNNHMIMIGNETDLHYKVVDLIRKFHPDSILVAGLGENQDTEDKGLDSWSYKKGYKRGQPDLMVLNYHKDFVGLCIEFKSPTNIYRVSEAQKGMKKRYADNAWLCIYPVR